MVVNAINTLEKRDNLKKDMTNFLSSVCVRIKLVAVVLEQKHHQQQKSLMQISKNCKPEPENHVLKHHYEFVTLL